jgi:hypothetical protein
MTARERAALAISRSLSVNDWEEVLVALRASRVTGFAVFTPRAARDRGGEPATTGSPLTGLAPR